MAETIPVLSEHESYKEINTTSPTNYTPTAEERAALKLANKLFEKAKKNRAKYDARWLDYYRMVRGKQWKEQRPSYRHSEVINMVFQHIQSQVPILADARQRFEFLPEDPTDIEFAEIMDQVAESDWQRNNWTYVLAENLYDAHYYGTSIGAVEYDPSARYGDGSIEIESKDPHYCFPDPKSTDVNKGGDYFCYAEPVELEKIKKEYPDKAKHIKPDLIDLMKGDKFEDDSNMYRSPVDSKTILEGTNPQEIAENQDKALKVTVYLKSDEYDETKNESVDPATGELKTEFEQKLKYPKGRKICFAGGVLLEDGPIPYDDGLFPFARLVNYIDPREFWGISEVEQLESPQKIFNKLVSFALDVLTLMGNPIWIVDTNSEVDTDNLFNQPGLIIEKAPNSQVQRQEGVQLQPYVLQLIDRMRNWFEEQGGSQDITRGVRPEGVTAASAISQLQEAAQTRIRQKSRNLDAYLQNLGQLYKNRVFQFYSSPRIVRVTNNEKAQSFFKFHIDTVENPDGTTQRKATVRKFNQDPVTGQYSEDVEAKEYLIQGDFDVRVSTGSALPFAKDVKFNRARQMFLDGVIDEEEYLKAADYPNWEAVLNRVMQKKAEMAQAEAAAAGGGGPPPAA